MVTASHLPSLAAAAALTIRSQSTFDLLSANIDVRYETDVSCCW
jgi:hypothetical protein